MRGPLGCWVRLVLQRGTWGDGTQKLPTLFRFAQSLESVSDVGSPSRQRTKHVVCELVSKRISELQLKEGFTVRFGPAILIKTSSASVWNGCMTSRLRCVGWLFQTRGPAALVAPGVAWCACFGAKLSGFFCHFLPYKTRCKMRLGCLRVEARRQRTVLRSHPAAVRRCHSKHTHIELGHQRPVNVRGLHSWRGRLECPPEVCHRASSLIYVCGCTFCNSTFLFFSVLVVWCRLCRAVTDSFKLKVFLYIYRDWK